MTQSTDNLKSFPSNGGVARGAAGEPRPTASWHEADRAWRLHLSSTIRARRQETGTSQGELARLCPNSLESYTLSVASRGAPVTMTAILSIYAGMSEGGCPDAQWEGMHTLIQAAAARAPVNRSSRPNDTMKRPVNDWMRRFGLWADQMRRARGLTAYELAEMSDLPHGHLCTFLLGERVLSTNRSIRMLVALDPSLDELEMLYEEFLYNDNI